MRCGRWSRQGTSTVFVTSEQVVALKPRSELVVLCAPFSPA